MENYDIKRAQMANLLSIKGISDPLVLKALQSVPRHLFVPKNLKKNAYDDCALPIANDQTISQPYIVGFMTEAALIDEESKVLEIGTGSGYQAAILAEICKEVYSVEIIHEFALSANKLLHEIGYSNAHVKYGDGYAGWLEKAPFEAIIITAAAKQIPQTLLNQLEVDGCIIMPLENKLKAQTLVKVIKTDHNNNYSIENLLPVRFVPMVESVA
jgi:protein-L-isoaspartate(D-aspartate) O-methyltransferase